MAGEEHRANEADPWLAAFMARSFLRGVGRQGRRLLKLPATVGRDVTLLEEHLFAVTAHQATAWLEAVCRNRRLTISKKDCEPYLSLRSEIKELRDMREHGDEYLRGKGDKPDRFVRHDDQRGMAADASSTIVTDQGYELGLRVTVEQVMEAAEAVLPTVEAIVEEGDAEDD